jgi:hypothetical protein
MAIRTTLTMSVHSSGMEATRVPMATTPAPALPLPASIQAIAIKGGLELNAPMAVVIQITLDSFVLAKQKGVARNRLLTATSALRN